jgi:predicted metalloprotease with PDZ domain
VTAAAGGQTFSDFNARYIDGRDTFPYAAVFAQAGLVATLDSTRVARVGISTKGDSTAETVQAVTPGSAFATAGGLVGDQLVRVGDIDASQGSWAVQFRAKYGSAAEGTMIPVTVRRAGQTVNLQMPLRFVTLSTYHLTTDPSASPAAVRIRHGIMTGTVDQ